MTWSYGPIMRSNLSGLVGERPKNVARYWNLYEWDLSHSPLSCMEHRGVSLDDFSHPSQKSRSEIIIFGTHTN